MEKQKRKSGIGVAVWISVALLLILVLTTLALLGATLKSWPQGEKNVIALFPSNRDDPEHVYKIDRVPADFAPSVDLADRVNSDGTSDGPMYESGNTIDLFKDTYLNADGQVIVQSSNGDKIIAPGTQNTYEFSLKNTGNVSLDYTLKLDGLFAFANENLPIVVRLSYGDEWIVGAEDKWIPWNEMSEVFDTRTVESGDYAIYKFEWKWPYEVEGDLLNDMNNALLEADKNDTSLGNAATDTSTKFDLNIRTVATVTEGAVPVDNFGNRLFTDVLTKLDVTYIGVYILIIIIVAIALEVFFVYFFIFKRKNAADTVVLLQAPLADEEEAPSEEEKTEETVMPAVLEEEPAAEEEAAPETEEPVIPEVLEEEPAAEEATAPETEEPVIPAVLEEEPAVAEAPESVGGVAVLVAADEASEEAVEEAVEETEPEYSVVVEVESLLEGEGLGAVDEAMLGYGEIKLRRSYTARLIQTDDNIKTYYNEIKNILLSYKGVKARTSWKAETFKQGRTHIAKIDIKGKKLYLYLALDPAEFADSKYFINDVSAKSEELPLLIKVKSDRALNHASELVEILAEKLALVKTEKALVDYRMPYETDKALVERDLIKLVKLDTVLDDATAAEETVEAVEAEEPVAEVAPEATEEAVIEEAPAVEETVEAAEAEEPVAEEAPEATEEAAIEEAPVVEETVEAVEAEESVAEEAPEATEEAVIEETPAVEETVEMPTAESDSQERSGMQRATVTLLPGMTPSVSRPPRTMNATRKSGTKNTEVPIADFADAYPPEGVVNIENLKENNIINQNAERIKITARGNLNKPLSVYADAFSTEAERKIERVGGKAIVVDQADTKK